MSRGHHEPARKTRHLVLPSGGAQVRKIKFALHIDEDNDLGKQRKKKQQPAPRLARDVAIDVIKKTVENPDWDRSKEGHAAFPRLIVSDVNKRESAVESLYARHFLGHSQKMAADKFRSIWEAAGAKTSSLDYSQDRVDGGRSDPLISRMDAAHELHRCRVLLGRRGFESLQKVCGEGNGLGELAAQKRDRLTMADNLRADLDDLATMWHMQTRQRVERAANATKKAERPPKTRSRA